MTRFARSKGSKSSNERIPESSTPWKVMQTQLEDKKRDAEDRNNKKQFDEKRMENYKNFLKEEKEKTISKSWCEFENKTSPSIVKSEQPKLTKKKKKKAKKRVAKDDKTSGSENGSLIDVDDPELAKWCDEHSDEESKAKYEALTLQLEKICEKEKIIMKTEITPPTENINSMHSESNIKLTKNRKRKLDVADDAQSSKRNPNNLIINQQIDINTEQSNDTKSHENLNEIEKSPKKKKRTKKKLKKNNLSQEDATIDNTVNELQKINQAMEEKSKKKKDITKKNKEIKFQKANLLEEKKFIEKDQLNKNTRKKNAQPSNPVMEEKFNQKNHARRKPIATEKILIVVNGETLEISNYDGFPILSKDAERLQQLRKNLISKGIPRSEVDRTLKLERRKAEKNLSRMKKKLCFHCRKGGHNLSECPELNKESDSTGIPSSGLCFKCGSTEHTHFACKVVRTQEYKFAQCFICKEQGHISRQCPDNPRGLYPKGGGCRECGDVTHLKKDCPKIMQKREDDTVRLETLNFENVEDMHLQETLPSIKKSEIKRVRF